MSSRRVFTLSIDTENAAFRNGDATVDDHKYQADAEAGDGSCICGQPFAAHDDDTDRIREVARILRHAAEVMEADLRDTVPLVDIYGHLVGTGQFRLIGGGPSREDYENPYRVGARDWTHGIQDEDMCGAHDGNGKICTRNRHWPDPTHVAGDGEHIVAVWEDR